MKISVVIPSYNRGEMIAVTLDAILGQSRKPDEIIVVDDGSTDNTVEFVGEKYGDAVRLIRQENGGPESARKHGIEAATGDWIALCDSDDIWLLDHLERLCVMHARYPDADCLSANFTEVGSSARHQDKFLSMGEAFWAQARKDEDGFMYLGPDQFKRLLPGNPFFTSATMFSKALYDRAGGINPAYARLPAGDADLTRRMALVGTMACDWHISVQINKHGENFSADGFRNGMGKIVMLKDYLGQPDMFGRYEGDIREAVERAAIALMYGAFAARNMADFDTAAAELPFGKRPFGLKVRSLFAALPRGLVKMIFSLYDRTQQTKETH